MSLATLLAACPGKDPEPAPKQYRVGGTLNGLSGSLTLQLNGQQSLTRTADGPFSFETPLDDQSNYAVTVATQPPEQQCTVENGTGKVSGADVSSVQVRCAGSTYSVGGTVQGLGGPLELKLGDEVLRVTQEGRFTFTTKLAKGGAYAVSVATLPQGQRCSVSNGSGTVAGNVEDISIRCTYWYALDNFQAARVVIGQDDFTSDAPNREGDPGANTLNGPWGNPTFANGRLYIPDQGNNRVLGFNGVPAANGAQAGFVLGQPNFTSDATGVGQSGVGHPEGLSSDGSRLAVADLDNNRVLLYSVLPASTGAMPTTVIGRVSFADVEPNPPCDPRSLRGLEDVFIGHGKLVVADSGHNRVLIWNTIPTTNGAPADLVLGQGSFTTCTENDADGDGTRDATPSASTMWLPTGVWTDGTRLVVADYVNNRVLLWNSFPTRNGQPADVVLGQQDFTSRESATSASRMSSPYFIAATGLQLFVADNQNNRVLGWNQFPTTNGAPADLVLGQADFDSANPQDPATRATSARSLRSPSGLHLAWPHVVVSDYGANRVLVFESR
ncbi:NHL repeat-containing protein [Archangium lipolyticum]|uniref:hypothetical protein n=1 Tax=Archangium lipolyticum TaxID=2970465 RepID=UPI00214A8B17|nr:hypothetical protein [Archangium lipolyticum]